MEKTELYSAQLSIDDNKKFKEVANYRGMPKASVLRVWIRNAHRAINKRDYHVPQPTDGRESK